MRILFILLYCSLGFNGISMPSDTISVWHLKYNNQKLVDVFPIAFNRVDITVSKDTLTDESVFSISQAMGCYFCETCKTYFAVYDQNEKLVEMVTGINARKALKMSFRKLLAYNKSTGEDLFDFYYQEGSKPSIENATHVLRLTLVD